MKIFWLFVVLFSCSNCNTTYTTDASYVEDWHWNPDKKVVKSSKTNVKYEWKD